MTTLDLTASSTTTGRSESLDHWTRVLCVLFFFSGFPALIYQLTWQRALFRIFGVNIESVTIVVTAFMLGLGLGSLAGGWLSKRRSMPLLPLLAAIEILTGIFGVGSLAIFVLPWLAGLLGLTDDRAGLWIGASVQEVAQVVTAGGAISAAALATATVSKLARVVEEISHRPQVQERMTEQIANLLVEELQVKGVAVVIEAAHSCMSIRGVRKPDSVCVTSAMKGIFRSNLSSRSEVMNLIYGARS